MKGEGCSCIKNSTNTTGHPTTLKRSSAARGSFCNSAMAAMKRGLLMPDWSAGLPEMRANRSGVSHSTRKAKVEREPRSAHARRSVTTYSVYPQQDAAWEAWRPAWPLAPLVAQEPTFWPAARSSAQIRHPTKLLLTSYRSPRLARNPF